MNSFAQDSYEYQTGAVQLAGYLKSGHLASWATAGQPIHVKILAVTFALLGPIVGYGTLSAEPFNLLCYAAIVGLTFATGNEAYSHRVGLLSGAAVAIFPSLLLHTTQLLKDPLFIAGLLAFMLCLTTLLTRTYGPRLACGVAAVTLLMLMLLFLVRRNVVIVMPVVGLLVLLLLVARQYLQRRLLIWNMLPVVTLLTAVLFMSSYSGHTLQIQKRFPATVGGRPKIVAAGEAQVPARIAWIASPAIEWNSNSVVGRYGAAADTLARRISGMRSRFVATYPDAGSTLDVGAEFRSARRLLEYLPRAVAIGLWAPFPDQWAIAGRRVGNAGRLLSALETFVIYLCQLFVLLAIARDPRRPALWFLAVVAVLGVAALAVVIPNVGALYRFRYTFWILMIVVAMVFVDHLLSIVALRKRSSPQVLAPAPSSYEQAT